MAQWEPQVQNYLGFPEGVAGEDLLRKGAEQARNYGVEIIDDEIVSASRGGKLFHLRGKVKSYSATHVLLATGIFHLPPRIEGVDECLGHSMFFCKDCDGFRVQGKTILIYGWNNEAVDYALSMLLYSPVVGLTLDAHKPTWDSAHEQWVREHEIPIYTQRVIRVRRNDSQIRALVFDDGSEVKLDALFTTRGDVYFNRLAKDLGARVDKKGQIEVNECLATSVQGLYAAGCVTPANCQMIIAAGEGAKAGQAINRDLFEESLATHQLRRFRRTQLRNTETEPAREPAER